MSADANFASLVLTHAPAFTSYNVRQYATSYESRIYVIGIGENTIVAQSKFVIVDSNIPTLKHHKCKMS